MYQSGQVYIGDAPANDSTKSLVLASHLKARKVAIAYEEEVEKNKRFASMVGDFTFFVGDFIIFWWVILSFFG